MADITTARTGEMTTIEGENGAKLLRERRQLIAGTRLAIVAAGAWRLAEAYQHSLDEFGSTTIVFNELGPACAWFELDRVHARVTIQRLRDELHA